MPVLKYNNNIINLGQFDGITISIKTGEYINSSNKKYEVVTCVYIKDLEGNTLYKLENYSSFICKLQYDKNIFNFEDVIDDLPLYINHCNIEKYWKDIIITSYLFNEYKGQSAVKGFKREFYNNLQEQIRQEKRYIEFNENKLKIENLKKEIFDTIDKINKYEQMRIIYPNWKKDSENSINIYTKNTMKSFEFYSLINEADKKGITTHENILSFLNEFLNYCINDFDPVEFMKFDKVRKTA